MAKKEKTVDLGDDRVEQFMKRLATDDDLRAAVKRDPVAALVGAGVKVPMKDLPKKVELPSKAALKARLKQLAEKKKAGLALHVPHPHDFVHVVLDTCEDVDERRKVPKPPKPKPKPKPAPKPTPPKGRKAKRK